jgi:hypothetical protein
VRKFNACVRSITFAIAQDRYGRSSPVGILEAIVSNKTILHVGNEPTSRTSKWFWPCVALIVAVAAIGLAAFVANVSGPGPVDFSTSSAFP